MPRSFPDWKSALLKVDSGVREAYQEEIFAFLHHCKNLHSAATIVLARTYLEQRERDRETGTRGAEMVF